MGMGRQDYPPKYGARVDSGKYLRQDPSQLYRQDPLEPRRDVSPLEVTKRRFRVDSGSPSKQSQFELARLQRNDSVENRGMRRESSNLQSPKFQAFKVQVPLEITGRPESVRQRRGPLSPYFMQPMSQALNKPYSEDYFDKLYREQFFEICKLINSLD